MNQVSLDKKRLEAAQVVVVGDAMLDRYWFGAVDRISPEAPVPVVRVMREEVRLGGAANVAMNIAKLGSASTLMSVVGADEAGDRILNLVASAGIRPLIERDGDVHTIVKLRVIGRSQQLIRLDFDAPPQQELLLRMLGSFDGVIARHDAVVFSDYGKGGLSHVASMIQKARAAGKAVLVDPKGSDYSRYAGANVVTPNLAELAQVVGTWPDEAALSERAQALRERLGLQALVLTRADEGMTLFDAEGSLHVPTLAREVFDVTGAGDTVIATLACMLAAGMPLRDAVPIANRAGGLIVSRFGTAGLSYDELFG
jgi:rfaE bifunctional protein kinase chain/domain